MIRLLLPLFLFLTPTFCRAEPVKIQSGEHADFSRIVLQFESSPDWVFGRVEDGYELRFSPDADLDLSNVFDRIPKTRISGLNQTGPNVLFFDVSCDCAGDAFEIRAGRLVVDIKNGPVDPDSPFEKRLPTIPAQTSTQDLRAGIFRYGPEFEITKSLPNFAKLDNLPAHHIDLGERASETSRPEEPDLTPIQFTAIPSTDIFPLLRDEDRDLGIVAQQPDDRAGAPPQDTSRDEISDAQSPTLENTTPSLTQKTELPFFVGNYPLLELPTSSTVQNTNRAQSVLLSGLLRSASQGMVLLETPDVPSAPGNDSSGRKEPHISAQEQDPPVRIDRPPALAGEHLRVESAVDRGAVPNNNSMALTQDGEICLEPKLFDVRQWGHTGQVAHSLDALRASLIGEFDKPDFSAIEGLARRYIFLGFGAEAMALLNAFPTGSESEKILRELSGILDERPADPTGILLGQVSCATPAALWGILAHDEIPDGNFHDIKSILQTFSGLPVHLRQHLGPRIAQRFLAADDLESAAAIRNLLDRAPEADGPRFDLIKARIAAKSGDVDLSIETWEQVVNADSPQSAAALADMIEAMLENGQPIAENIARSADALAVEYRGLELGSRLMRAAIRAFANNGNIQTTFARIEAAVATGDMVGDEAEQLRAEAHFRNVSDSDDGQFLEILFENEVPDSDHSVATSAARLAIARRLTELGFTSSARSVIAPIRDAEADDFRILLADLLIAEERPDEAADHLEGLNTERADRLRAIISEKTGDFANAAQLFKQVGDSEGYESAIWRSGDWEQISTLDLPVKSAAAALVLTPVLQTQPIPENAPAALGMAENSEGLGMSKPLELGRSMLEHSRSSRKVLSDLFELDAES